MENKYDIRLSIYSTAKCIAPRVVRIYVCETMDVNSWTFKPFRQQHDLNCKHE